MRIPITTMLVATATALLLAGPTSAPAQMDTARVEIQAHGFSAPTLTVKAGTTVTWTNRDDDAHTVTSVSGRGVGMDVIRSLAEEHGGAVTIASTAGSGTELTIDLPLSPAAAGA